MNMNRLDIEYSEDWRGKIDTIPFIKFPSDWEIQIIPPFGNAVARFRVKLPDGREKSIYLDYDHHLGFWSEDGEMKPYWEVYPHYGDVARCGQYDIKSLLKYISEPSEE